MAKEQAIISLEFTRKAGAVKRFHTMTTLIEDRVSTHTYNVMNLVIELTENRISVELLKAALYHDVTECLIGDIPTNIKQDNPDLDAAFKRIEEEIEAKHGFKEFLSEEEKATLKMADVLEGLWYSVEEVERGNFELKTAVLVYRKKFLKLHVNEIADGIFNHLLRRFEERIGE